MEFSRFDAVILVGMSLGIIFMSFTFPALGLTAENATQKGDIPEFNMSGDRFDFAGQFPRNPGAPSRGELEWNKDNVDISDNQQWLDGDTSGGTEHSLINFDTNNASGADFEVRVIDWSSGSSIEDNYTISQDGQIISHNNFSYEIIYEVTELEESGAANATVEYKIDDQPEDSGFLERIPVVGGIFSAGSKLASIVGWIGAVIWWGITWFFEIAATLILILFNAISYATSLFHWLMTTYFGVVSSAHAPWSALLMVPGIVLFVEFMKLGMIGISLLPTT